MAGNPWSLTLGSLCSPRNRKYISYLAIWTVLRWGPHFWLYQLLRCLPSLCDGTRLQMCRCLSNVSLQNSCLGYSKWSTLLWAVPWFLDKYISVESFQWEQIPGDDISKTHNLHNSDKGGQYVVLFLGDLFCPFSLHQYKNMVYPVFCEIIQNSWKQLKSYCFNSMSWFLFICSSEQLHVVEESSPGDLNLTPDFWVTPTEVRDLKD